MIFRGYWIKGFFQTIANIPLTDEEKNLDYGFFDMEPLERYGYFVNSRGEEIDTMPKLDGPYGICNIYAIHFSIFCERLFRDEE